jgi:hypothetical protein
MGKRDAFGNEIKSEDDALDAMGWKVGDPTPPASMGETSAPVVAASSGVQPTAAAQPTVIQPTATSTSIPTAPRVQAPRMPSQLPSIPGGGGINMVGGIINAIRLVVVLAIVGGVGFGIWSAVDTAKDVTNRFTIPRFTTPQVNLPGITTPTATPGSTATPEKPVKPSQPPVGLGPRSLVRAEAFAPALVKVREQGTRAQTMRVDPTRISANVLSNDDLLRIVSVTWEGNLQTIKTSSRLTGASTVSLKNVSSQSPSRALARSAKLLGQPARNFNYMVLLNFAGKAEWVVYFKDGKYVKASLDGRSVQRVN